MKICLLSYRGNPFCGGQGIYLIYLARELVRQGHEVHCVVGPPYPDLEPGIVFHKIPNNNYYNNRKFACTDKSFSTLHPLNLFEFIYSKMGFFPEMLAFSIRSFIKVNNLVKKEKFDIIHDNQGLGYGLLLFKCLRIPLTATIHHPLTIDRATWFEYPSTFATKIKRMLYYPLIMQPLVARKLESIITVSHDAAGQIEEAFKVPKKNIQVVYNGLDTDLFYPVKAVKRPNSLIFVGNVEDRKKGIIYLLKALTLTKNRVHLTIVDGGAPNRKHVPAWIDKFKLNGSITLTGKISLGQLRELYGETCIAVAPSLYEGFGFPAAEAMACELPVIASAAGALPEVVGEHRKTAYIVPPRDPEALAQAIDALITDSKLRTDIGKAARRRIQEKFTWRQAGTELEKIYSEAIDAHS